MALVGEKGLHLTVTGYLCVMGWVGVRGVEKVLRIALCFWDELVKHSK